MVDCGAPLCSAWPLSCRFASPVACRGLLDCLALIPVAPGCALRAPLACECQKFLPSPTYAVCPLNVRVDCSCLSFSAWRGPVGGVGVLAQAGAVAWSGRCLCGGQHGHAGADPGLERAVLEPCAGVFQLLCAGGCGNGGGLGTAVAGAHALALVAVPGGAVAGSAVVVCADTSQFAGTCVCTQSGVHGAAGGAAAAMAADAAAQSL